jgi:hypothetical protein
MTAAPPKNAPVTTARRACLYACGSKLPTDKRAEKRARHDSELGQKTHHPRNKRKCDAKGHRPDQRGGATAAAAATTLKAP